MKTKSKVIVLLEIAIVLCSMFLVTLPATAIAAEEDDYVLGIYGNANEDDTIDMRDLTYVKLIFFGKKPETELADAKYDGKTNPLDFIQIKLIIVGKEKELTIVDSTDKIVTVNKPVERVLSLTPPSAEVIKLVGAVDKLVGVSTIFHGETFYPEISKLPSVGSWSNPDYEKILELRPDLIITYISGNPKIEDKLPGIAVVRFEYNNPKTMIDVWRKIGYILDKKDEAEEFIDWYEGYMDKIESRTEELSEDEKPRVYMGYYYQGADRVFGKDSIWDTTCTKVGGINIAGDIKGGKVDIEWVLVQDPEIIALRVPGVPHGYDVDDPTGMQEHREMFMSRPGWKDITAVKNKNVYLFGWNMCAGPHSLIMTAYMAKWFHPELFEDLDPQAIHQEYLTEFQHIDFNVYEHGVFVYPPFED